ncbi:hypothetical protein [Calothrix sp. NIES-3974]|uniref:hypothetical protein n=1 Tax=Calothrix sp. NIES-3974 TaxID=2005462 RepID=UPI000B607E7F|nr:hypothetical protein [Calothrix sp. NIES-3974]BAZ04261.1 hypothetical protein NIES3974_08940 [Calothrix sp. NIES-3974]
MLKHYILSLNPTAKHEWDRCVLREPLTAKRPDIARIVADAVGSQQGNYLVSVNIEVQVLEHVSPPQIEQLSLNIAPTPEKSQLREAA